MIKNILLAGTMMIAAPAFAQTAPAAGHGTAAPAPTVPASGSTTTGAATTAPQSATAQAAPATTPDATAAQPASSQAANATSSSATPAPTQVAQVVDQQFATYDKDGDGALSKAEFSAWMTALKSQAPTAPKESPAQQTAWNDAAFKQADGDKSASVTKTELTSFLVKGASQAS